jgi:serine/threonine-protein kinase
VPLEPGQSIDGKYRVIRRIGEGGMGTVYEGENVRIGRRVAIKVLHETVAARPEFAARFEREARAAAKIGSPHICDVLDLGDLPNGERFIVMEFLEGESLESRLESVGKVSDDTLLPIAFEILEALATMHENGVIHRDLKPANVYLARTQAGRGEAVKILDFGVSKFLPAPGESSDMTSTGTLMGTPLYMSPEQARGLRNIDGRADLYSASVMFYRALAGELPFTAENFNELMFKIALEDPKPIREIAPEVDDDLAAIVHRGLARAPDARFRSAREYQESLLAWARTQGRVSLSLLRITASEKALVEGASRRTSPDAADAAKAALTLERRRTTRADAPVGSAKDGTPIAWSEEGPIGAHGTQILAPSTEKDPAPAGLGAARSPVAQTLASSDAARRAGAGGDAGAENGNASGNANANANANGNASASANADHAGAGAGANAVTQPAATPAGTKRWMLPAVAAAALVVGALGWRVMHRPATNDVAPPAAAASVPSPQTSAGPAPTAAALPPGAPGAPAATTTPEAPAPPGTAEPGPDEPSATSDETDGTGEKGQDDTSEPRGAAAARPTAPAHGAAPAAPAHGARPKPPKAQASATTAPTAPAPTTSSKGRVFRTHID